jgi:uncharacterized repeat protein (TIGR03803 family)
MSASNVVISLNPCSVSELAHKVEAQILPVLLKHAGLAVVVMLLLTLGPMCSVNAQSFTLLHTFSTEDANDQPPVIEPGAPKLSGILAQGRDGNLYGTTPVGGTGTIPDGTVYQITPSGVVTVLHSFPCCADGELAVGGLTLATDGSFYGTTQQGGSANYGTIFTITQSGTLKYLRNLSWSDGVYPTAPPIEGRDGNFYGTTSQGGLGNGTAYKITAKGVFTKLCDFTTILLVRAPLIQAVDGNFYGTAEGGTHSFGAVFRVTSTGKVTLIYNFDNSHGADPVGPVIQGSDGNFYGTTSDGGDTNGDGALFKLTPKGTITLLHTFNGSDGSRPLGGMVQASDGNFYGATSAGGAQGDGTLFKVTAQGAFSLLFDFTFKTSGTAPQLTLLQHTNGLLYGDTFDGGTVIEDGEQLNGQGTFYSLEEGLPPFVSLLPRAGKVGTLIGVLGQGFTGATNVSFNGASASFTVNASGTYLTAVVPSAASTGLVSVTTSSGVLKSLKSFIVIPTIAGFSPTSGKVGDQVVIMGSGLTGAVQVTFGGIKATIFTVNSGSQVTSTVPTGAKTGKIAIKTAGGIATSSATFTVLQ